MIPYQEVLLASIFHQHPNLRISFFGSQALRFAFLSNFFIIREKLLYK
jgi:hypothetical protein